MYKIVRYKFHINIIFTKNRILTPKNAFFCKFDISESGAILRVFSKLHFCRANERIKHFCVRYLKR